MAAAGPAAVVEGLPFAEDKKRYILETLDPVLEEMVSDTLTEMPDDPQLFMIQWLRKRAGVTQGRQSVKQKNQALRSELARANGFMQEAGGAIAGAGGDEAHSSEDESDDDCDDIPESFRKPEAQMGRARQSVSAEAYGQWNQKQAFTPPSFPKSDDQKYRLNDTLQKSFMFSNLEASDMESVVMAMKECDFEGGTKVITEGDDGDFLFVIERGSLDCIKNIGGEDRVVKTCASGDVFGELALLYNCPRAASVVAAEASVCWQLDRETFNHIVKESSMKRRNKYEQFLGSVSLLAGIDQYERSQIADALKLEIYTRGDIIMKEGDPGDLFYLVEDGLLFAEKGGARVMEYKAGDYFGELALLRNQPRAASVHVESDTAKVLALGRQSFNKMLGPLQELLSRNVANYK